MRHYNVLTKSFTVVYVVFYDDIELILWIDGKYDDHYDSKVRYKTSNKMNMCSLYC